MITSRAIRLFLRRARSDHSHWNDLTERALEEKQLCLPVKPPIWKKLRVKQRICLLLGVKYKRFAFWADIGAGKTLLSIALSRYFRKVGAKGRFLVLVPNKSNKWEWEREVRKHSPSSVCCVLNGSSQHKWEMLRTVDADLVIETYAGLSRMVSELVTVTKGRHKGKNKLRLDKKALRELQKLICGLFLDESTSAKNWRALPFRICRQFAKTVEYLFCLSGTPFGRDPKDLWAQMFLVDGGFSLGETLGLFRAAFYKEKESPFGHIEYEFDDSKKELLYKFLCHRSIRYEVDPSLKPKVILKKYHAALPQEASVYYAKARDLLIKSRGNYQEMKNAFMRMRQISSGFLGYRDDETGDRARFEFEDKPKLRLLLRVLDKFSDEKSIVFHEFIFSGQLISRELDKLGVDHLLLNGRTKDARSVLHAFDHDERKSVLLLNNAAGGYGLNLQVARNAIFYESPVAVILRKQTQGRVDRPGSAHKWVRIIDLVTRGTEDEHILAFHAEGKDLFRAIIDGRAPVP